MTLTELISFVGFPAICGAVGYILARVKNYHKQTLALQEGVQALLRNSMLKSYYYCKRQGFASYDEREDWSHMYLNYKLLGGNGAMEDIKEKMSQLPTEKEA